MLGRISRTAVEGSTRKATAEGRKGRSDMSPIGADGDRDQHNHEGPKEREKAAASDPYTSMDAPFDRWVLSSVAKSLNAEHKSDDADRQTDQWQSAENTEVVGQKRLGVFVWDDSARGISFRNDLRGNDGQIGATLNTPNRAF
jgi:hypothetical protein